MDCGKEDDNFSAMVLFSFITVEDAAMANLWLLPLREIMGVATPARGLGPVTAQ